MLLRYICGSVLLGMCALAAGCAASDSDPAPEGTPVAPAPESTEYQSYYNGGQSGPSASGSAEGATEGAAGESGN